MSKVRIEVMGPNEAKVWVDDVEQTRLIGIDLRVGLKDEPASVVLTQRIYGEVEVEGVMEVTVLDNQGSRAWAPTDG